MIANILLLNPHSFRTFKITQEKLIKPNCKNQPDKPHFKTLQSALKNQLLRIPATKNQLKLKLKNTQFTQVNKRWVAPQQYATQRTN
jgi:hypothetical protein